MGNSVIRYWSAPLRIIGVIVIVKLLASGFLSAQTNPIEIVADMDNTIHGLDTTSTDTVSNGQGLHFYVGRNGQASGYERRGLIRFNVAANVPINATIDSVWVTLNMGQSPTSNPETINFHKVIKDWGEGASFHAGGMGSPAQTNDATWVQNFYPDSLWTNPGGDFDSTASGTGTVAGVGVYKFSSSGGMRNDVAEWYNNPGENFGWILIGDETTASTVKQFDSRQDTTAADRPLLSVFYRIPIAIYESDIESIKIYPNPFSNEINLDNLNSLGTVLNITVIDGTGKDVIYATQLGERNRINLDATNLKHGFYIIVIEGSARTFRRRLIKYY